MAMREPASEAQSAARTGPEWPGLVVELIRQLDTGRVYALDLPAIARRLRRPDPSLGGEIALEGFAGHARHAAVLGGGPGFEPVVEVRGHAEP